MEFINVSEQTKVNSKKNTEISKSLDKEVATLFSNALILETVSVVEKIDLTVDDVDEDNVDEDDGEEDDGEEDDGDEDDVDEDDVDEDDVDDESVDEPDDGQYTLLGLSTYGYTDKSCSDDTCKFKYTDDIFTGSILYCKKGGRCVKIQLTRSEGECGSGWCKATFGHLKISYQTYSRDAFEYVPNDSNAKFNLDTPSKYFYFSEYGYDEYYPTGGYKIHYEYFKHP